jgi:hypothetical protein
VLFGRESHYYLRKYESNVSQLMNLPTSFSRPTIDVPRRPQGRSVSFSLVNLFVHRSLFICRATDSPFIPSALHIIRASAITAPTLPSSLLTKLGSCFILTLYLASILDRKCKVVKGYESVMYVKGVRRKRKPQNQQKWASKSDLGDIKEGFGLVAQR